jgi:exosortase/archaeosortase family protein
VTAPRPFLEGRLGVAMVAASAVLLILLPFTATFDEALTSGALRLGLAQPLQDLAPAVAAQAAGILHLLGVRAASSGSYMTVWNAQGGPVPVFLSWNCLGWQSAVLLGISLVSGLRGEMPWETRLQVVLLGAAGTYLVNLARIVLVLLIAADWGYVPAVVFHDYAGLLLPLFWLFGFWFAVQRLLVREAVAQ